MGGRQKSNWYPDRGSRLTGIKVEIEVGGWNLGQAQGKRQARVVRVEVGGKQSGQYPDCVQGGWQAEECPYPG